MSTFEFPEVLRALRARQLVDFVRHDGTVRADRLKPAGRVDVRVEPRMPRVHDVDDERDARRAGEIRLRHPREFIDGLRAAPGVAVAGQIGEIYRPPAGTARTAFRGDPIQVRQAGLARRRTRPRELRARQRVDERRLADVRAADERDVRETVFRDRVGVRGARDELRVEDLQCDTDGCSPVTAAVSTAGVTRPIGSASAIRNTSSIDSTM
jgi:hypothetical protein